MRFEKYIFICLNERIENHPRGCCMHNGAHEIFDEFKRIIGEKKLKLKIRVNRTGCMELCEIGPVVMIHPDNVWYSPVTSEDVQEIVESHIIEGVPVDRLKADFSRWNRAKG